MLLWLVAAAHAHHPGLSFAQVEAGAIEVVVAEAELVDRFPLGDLQAVDTLLFDATLARTAVAVDGEPCTVARPAVARAPANGIVVRADLACPPGDVWTVRVDWLGDLEPGHRQVLAAFGRPVAVLDVEAPEARFTASEPAHAVAWRFGQLGVEHIWTGYDHLLFLLGLLLVATKLREMLVVATGFTIAHSVTLSLAATGVVTLPSALVEPAIAASIVFVGIENLWRPPATRRRWITFGLGLVHGFGFAGLLAEIGLPAQGRLAALVSFNLGVELGQAVVVVVAMPILLWLRKAPWWETRAVPAASVLVALAGLGWLIERLVGA